MEIRPHPKGRNCVARVQLTHDNFRLLSALPGFKKWDERSLIFRPTGANIAYIQKYWPEAQWLEGSVSHVEEFILNAQRATDARAAKNLTITGDEDYKYKTFPPPYDHQRRAFVLSRDKPTFALLMEQGTGKTKVIIDTGAYLFAQGRIQAMVVIAPNNVHRNWIVNELPDHMPEWCPWEGYYHRANVTKTRAARLEAVLKSTGKLRVIALNIELMTTKNGQALLERLLEMMPCLLVVDESSHIKTPGAKRTKFITKAGKDAPYRRIMNGTPVTKGPEDLYGQFNFLSPEILGYDSFTSFKHHFCIEQKFETKGGQEFRKIVGYENLDELSTLIEGYSYRVLKAECLDLPPKIYKRLPIELTPAQRRIYDELVSEFIAELDGEQIMEENTMVRLMRLQQICCNWFPTRQELSEEKWATVCKPIDARNTRLEALISFLEDVQGKTIIWARFKPDLLLLTEALGRRAVSYYGGVSSDAKAQAIDRFQKDSTVDWFIANAQSAGIGLNLTAANNIIYYCNGYDLKLRLQSEDRAHRIGFKGDNLIITDMEAMRTVEKKAIKALRDKKNIADIIMRDPKSFFMES